MVKRSTDSLYSKESSREYVDWTHAGVASKAGLNCGALLLDADAMMLQIAHNKYLAIEPHFPQAHLLIYHIVDVLTRS